MNDKDDKQKRFRNYLLDEESEALRQASVEERKLLSSYLLGELNEQEREAVEERLWADEDFFKESLLAEDDLIDDYVQGDLSADQRNKFEATILCTPRGQQQVEVTRALRKSARVKRVAPIVWWRKPLQSQSFRIAASIFILLAIGLVGYRGFIYQPPANNGLALLKEAYKDERMLQARISEFDYAPLLITRGNNEEKLHNNKKSRAGYLLQTEVDENPDSAKAHHALGQYYLAIKDFDKAVNELKIAIAKEPNNAQIHSDLGAALLEKGKVEESKENKGTSGINFAESLEHLSKALQLDKASLPALFNRALLYEKMQLPRKALEDWKEYLKQDSNSGWADEAKKKIQELEEQQKQISKSRGEIFQEFLSAYQGKDDQKILSIVSQNNDMKGGLIENRLLDEYLDLSLNRQDEGALQKMQMLSYIGQLAQQKTGDFFINNNIKSYESLSLNQKSQIVEARRLIKSAEINLYGRRTEQALVQYQRAKNLFQNISNECEILAIDYQIAHSYLLQTKIKLALSIFEGIASLCEKKHYQLLQSQSLNAIATAYWNLSDYSMSILISHQALELSRKIGNPNGASKAFMQIGTNYLYLNNDKESLNFCLNSLILSNSFPTEAIQRWRTYYSISQPLNKLGFHTSAIEYQQEALRIAGDLKESLQSQAVLLTSYSYNLLGFLYGSQNNYSEAIKNIEIASEISKSFSTASGQDVVMAFSHLQLGHLYRKKEDFTAAIENYDKAICLYDKSQYGAFNYIAHKGKLLCCQKQNDATLTQQEIETTLTLFEKYRHKIREQNNRNIFFDAEQSIYDIAIDFAYSAQEDPLKALAYSERCRARSLLDMFNTETQVIDSSNRPDIHFTSVSETLELGEIQARLPKQSQIVQYAVLQDKILIWVISKNACWDVSYKISNQALNEKVLGYLDLLTKAPGSNQDALLNESIYLYEVLIKPIEQWLDADKQICIVPDKILNFVSYAALVNPLSRSYFLKEYRFLLAPSSSLFIKCTTAAKEKEVVTDEQLLSVGNPTFDQELFPQFQNLQSAAQEAEKIMPYYNRSSRCLIGEAADKETVKNEFVKSDIIHLALHAISDNPSPMFSKLLLAKESPSTDLRSKDNGLLSCSEIYNLNLKRAKLVVLSACRTAIESYYGGEGMMGLSRPFIAKRVPLVVASLWSVNSDSTKDLMIRFHQYRKEKALPTVEALRRAQLDLIDSNHQALRHPYNWAAFLVIGGYSLF
jgi:CHAT domain-containing protein